MVYTYLEKKAMQSVSFLSEHYIMEECEVHVVSNRFSMEYEQRI